MQLTCTFVVARTSFALRCAMEFQDSAVSRSAPHGRMARSMAIRRRRRSARTAACSSVVVMLAAMCCCGPTGAVATTLLQQVGSGIA